MRVPALLAAAATSATLVLSGAALIPAATAATVAADPGPDSSLSPEVERAASDLPKNETVRVIATFAVPGGTGKRPDAAAIREKRTEVLADLPKDGYDVVASYSRIPAVSLEADPATLDALAGDPRVLSVQEDHVVATTMAEANELTGANDVHDLGITGAGITAAIIDSGVDSSGGTVHPGLADDLVGQACFRTENDCINGTASAEDQNGHGTHVAGTITGPEGVAPDTTFYALKVFTTGNTSDTNILNALNHVIGLNTTTPGTVDMVNMSLGSSNYATQASCDAANAAYKTAFTTLNNQSVTVFVSTGNDADIAGVGAPGCVSGAVGVGSTGDATFTATFSSCTDNGQADKVSCFSNATPVQGDGELVDLLAPGCRITSTWLDNGTNTICGTSMATPYALGTAALAQEYAEAHDGRLSPTALEELLESTGQPVTDYRITSSPAYPRVAPPAAIGALAIGTPSNLLVTGTTPTSVSLSWTGVGPADHYELTRTDEASGSSTDIATVGTGTTFTDSTAPCGPLTYTVRAVNAEGVPSQRSNQVATSARPCPPTPGGVTLTRDDPDTQTVAWTLSGTVTNVVLQRRPAGGGFTDYQTLPGSTLSYQDTVATCGRVDYRVLTVAANGDRSAPSSVVGRSMCAPLNDDQADAEVVPVGAVGDTTTDVEPGAKYGSAEATDPPFSCHFGGAAPGFDGVWYAITPAAATRVSISTATTTLMPTEPGGPDTLIAVYRGTPSLVNEVACNDDIGGSNLRSTAIGNLKAGSTYYVHVAQWYDVPDNAAGQLVTTFAWQSPVAVPANDDWADRADIDTSPYTSTVTDAQNATTQGADPLHACAVQGARLGTHSLWWTFTPDLDGTLDLDTLASSGSFTDTLLSVYSGEPGSFDPVACNDDAGGGYRSQLVDVPVSAGTSYSVIVSRWSATPTATAGTVVLNAAFAATPALQLSKSAVAVVEGGPGDTYTARLTTQPTADVTVAPTGDADCTVSPNALTFTAANWDTPQTVTVTAPDDGAVEATEQCAVSHVLTSTDPAYDALAAPSVTGTVTDATVVTPPTPPTPPAAAGRPDARISAPGALVGDNVYGGSKQSRKAKASVGAKVTYTVSLQNDATAADQLTVRGAKSAKGFKVKYLAPDGTNITKAVVAGTYTTASLAPGATFDIKVVVKVGKKAEKKVKTSVTATSVRTPAATDVVHLLTKRK